MLPTDPAADTEPADGPPPVRQQGDGGAAVLRRLHEHLHGPQAGPEGTLGRETALQIAAQVLAAGGSAEPAAGAALLVLEDLRRHGWLEDHVDPAELRPLLRLTPAGRAFAEAFAGLDAPRLPTRQRHLRATAKALAAFAAAPDPDELLDACEHAAQVMQDLQQDIDHFRGLVRDLAREALQQKVAWEEFSEFATRRLGSAASVAEADAATAAERQRDLILVALERIRSLPPDRLAAADAALRDHALRLGTDLPPEAPVLALADRIEALVQTACSLKLPVLRQELGQHLRRAAGLLRQVLALEHGARSPLLRCAARLRDGTPPQRRQLLDTLAGLLASSRVRLPAGSLRWYPAETLQRRAPRPLDASWYGHAPGAAPFAMSELEILARLKRRSGGRVLRLSELPASDVADVLVILHAVDAARSGEGRKHFDVRKLASRFHTGYFAATDYELVPRKESQ